MLKNKFKIITLLLVIILSITVPIVRAENETANSTVENSTTVDSTATESDIMPISSEENSENSETSVIEGDPTVISEDATQEATTTSSEDNFKREDVFLTGDDVTIDYIVDGNLFVFANNVTINSQIGGDAFIFASTVTLGEQGYIYSNLFVASQTLNIQGVTYDLYTTSQDVSIAGYVYRDIHVASQSFYLSGVVGRNASIVADELIFAESADAQSEDIQTVTSQGQISGNLTYFSKSEASIPEGSVAGETNYTPISSTTTPTIQSYILSLGTFLVFVVVVWLLCLWLTPKFLETSNKLITKKPLPVIGFGFLTPIVVLILTILLLVLEITSSVGVLSLIALFIIVALSTSVFLIAINNIVCDKLKVQKSIGIFGSLIIVSALLWLISLIPYVGSILSFIAIIIGIGIIAYYPFSRKIDFSKEPEKTKKEEK